MPVNSGVYGAFIILNGITGVAFIILAALVLQNLVYTFDELTISDIPFYNNAGSTAQTRRLQFYWWFFASDLLRWIPIVISTDALFRAANYGDFNSIPYLVGIIFLLILETIKSIWLFVIWGTYCSSFQFCRNYDVLGDPNDANWVFLVAVWATFSFIWIDLIYSILIYIIRRESPRKKKEQMRAQTALMRSENPKPVNNYYLVQGPTPYYGDRRGYIAQSKLKHSQHTPLLHSNYDDYEDDYI